MLYEFTIYDVLLDKLGEIKVDVYENPLYEKTLILFDIWATQKKLGYLFDKYEAAEKKEKGLQDNKNTGESISSISFTKPPTYKEQYIEFLMQHDLIFLVEVKDKLSLLNLVFYWLLADVKKDKKLLDNF
jgi:hypothetical protein